MRQRQRRLHGYASSTSSYGHKDVIIRTRADQIDHNPALLKTAWMPSMPAAGRNAPPHPHARATTSAIDNPVSQERKKPRNVLLLFVDRDGDTHVGEALALLVGEALALLSTRTVAEQSSSRGGALRRSMNKRSQTLIAVWSKDERQCYCKRPLIAVRSTSESSAASPLT